MHRLTRVTLILFCLLIPYWGCRSFQKLDQLAVVNLVAIDQSDGERKMTVSLGIFKIPSAGGGGNKSEKQPAASSAGNIIVTQGRTIGEAVANLEINSPLILDYSHNKLLIVGRKLAENGINPFIDFIARDNSMRTSLQMMVASDRASQILQNKIEMEQNQPSALEMLISQTATANINTPIPIYYFLRNLKSDTGVAVAPMIEPQGKNKLNLKQMAIFANYKMVGQLNGSLTKTYQWLDQGLQNQTITFPNPKNRTENISLLIKRGSLSVQPIKKGNTYSVKTQAVVIASLVDASGLNGSNLNQAFIAEVETQANRYLKNQFLNLVSYSQKVLKVDLLGVGEKINNDYPYTWRKLKKSWRRRYSQLKFYVKFDVAIEDVGMVKESI